MKNKIRLDTMSEITDFVNEVSKFNFPITLESSDGFRVNAKSIIGALASMEFSDIWVVSDIDIYSKIERFVI